LKWVAGVDDRPYFIWYQTYLSHHFPKVRPPDVSEEAFQAARDFKKRAAGGTASERMFSFDSLGFSEDEKEGYLAVYDGAVAKSDQLLGYLLDGLKKMDRFANTIVLVTADHGETLGEKGLFSTHDSNLLEPTVRIPLVLRIPGSEPREVRAVTRSIDLAPTLGALAGLDTPAVLDGQSLIPLLDGKDLNLSAFSETRPKVVERGEFDRYRLLIPGIEGKLRSVRRDNYKLTVFPKPDGYELELYDLDLDPSESTNLMTELPAVARRMARELEEWFAGYADADTAPLELDADDLESLRALGYID
jgi:arylsulfatase A-like enzyme